jgi:hypothetical protein
MQLAWASRIARRTLLVDIRDCAAWSALNDYRHPVRIFGLKRKACDAFYKDLGHAHLDALRLRLALRCAQVLDTSRAEPTFTDAPSVCSLLNVVEAPDIRRDVVSSGDYMWASQHRL